MKYLFLALFFLIFPVAIQAANYPLEIINIKPVGTGSPAIGENNRIFRAYPGIEYNIRAAVIGGTYPFTFSLENAPSGMSVDEDSGEIVWVNPVSNAGPISLSVIDSEGATVTSQWNIEVTETGFHFVDASAVNGGDGSIENPWNDWRDFYFGLNDDTHAGDFIYFMDGTYTYPSEFTTGTTGSSNWLEIRENHPFAYLAFPGENNVFFDGERETNRVHLLVDEHNQYFQGINFIRGYGYGIQKHIGNYLTVLDCSFSDFRDSGSYSNQAGVLFRADAPSNGGTPPVRGPFN